ncbi:Rossmann-like and DUF2520 domain-containing protein [Rhodoferax antarcticus]|uniref:Rossmann-like and DUF2520 domain-containing protein n=1 Tax=Rhodoferax antarcticus TaxID=81479 RepID=UPI002224CCB0|nr:Rossmann-like and DUF2520 domain-containing protein [Rhodoferax antarcticus]MCW2312446.1 putative short-subunit dehydrogenase-like oxidoreductase (DUF2520 family) [Rhodoferax antarcticus]
MTRQTLNIIGAGRVGQTLGRLWHEARVYQVQAVVARSQASAEQAVAFIGAGQACCDLADLPAAQVWLLSVPDSQIAPLAATLAALHPAAAPALAFHCSGALTAQILDPLRALGWQTASAHPLLSFAQPARALAQFAGTPCALEGDASALFGLSVAFTHIGGRCFTLAAQDKLLYHAGAVLATNFMAVLQDLAERLWQHTGMPAELAQQMRATLLQNAVNNIVALGPQASLTGPAARGDWELVNRQAQALADWNAQASAAYTALSQLAGELARQTRQS